MRVGERESEASEIARGYFCFFDWLYWSSRFTYEQEPRCRARLRWKCVVIFCAAIYCWLKLQVKYIEVVILCEIALTKFRACGCFCCHEEKYRDDCITTNITCELQWSSRFMWNVIILVQLVYGLILITNLVKLI